MTALHTKETITIIPNRLYFSQLPFGQSEFSCYICFPPIITSEDSATLWWSCVSHDKPASSLSGIHVLTTRERERGRHFLSFLCPAMWNTATLTIKMETQTGVWSTVQEVFVYQQKQSFFLPLRGTVLVLGGHRIGEVHRSAWEIVSQQFAWDLLPLSEQGLGLLTSSVIELLQADDFAGFGVPVVASAEGTVVSCVNGKEDIENNIGQYPSNIEYFAQHPEEAAGNYVIIQHATGLYSCYLHLRNESICVKCGQSICQGEIIGKLGNSGFSSGPHLHFHFLSEPNLITGLPLPISLTVEGRTYAPTTGEILSQE